jgi:hypothetical protein
MKGEKWQMLAFQIILVLVLFLICIAGFLVFFVGVIPAALISTWIYTFANLYVYDKLITAQKV